jgi:hypothetical protein
MALNPTQFLIQWVLEALSIGIKQAVCGAVPPLPHMYSWLGAELSVEITLPTNMT